MTEIIPLTEIKSAQIVKRINAGEVFIYPTDTIYGIGCDATNEGSVKSIRIVKQRFDKPFSVIAPSKQWILKNFEANKSFIDKLPGPFTYILKSRKHNVVAPSVVQGEKIGIRIPNHEFIATIQKSKKPFVTTSVNIAGEAPYTDPKRIPKHILDSVDVVIDAGKLQNKPSTVLDLTGEYPRIVRP